MRERDREKERKVLWWRGVSLLSSFINEIISSSHFIIRVSMRIQRLVPYLNKAVLGFPFSFQILKETLVKFLNLLMVSAS